MPPPADPQARLQFDANVANAQMQSGQFEDAIASFGTLIDALSGTASLTDSHPLRLLTSMLAITWMRLGETRNCAVNHNAESCVLPLKGGGVHRDKEPVDQAIPLLEALLRGNAEDRTSKWLLNIANMARGTYPDGVPAPYRIDPHVFDSDDDIGRFVDVAPSVGMDVASRAGGVVVEDFDGDGNLDVLTSGWGADEPMHYFRSRGDGTFEDRTAAAGLTGLTGGLNLVQGDYDGDGFVDVLVLRGAWLAAPRGFPNSLLRNRGDGTFEDVTESAGILSFHPTQTAAFADFDGDGDLDLFIGNETIGDGNPHPNELWRNDGDGTFTDVGAAVGLALGGFTKGAGWGDYDNDGRPDLYVSQLGWPNALMHNDGPTRDGGWRFTDVAAAAGVTEPVQSFPTWWWDYDDDGWLDILVDSYSTSMTSGEDTPVGDVMADYVGLPAAGERLHLYHNDHDGTFTDVAHDAGVDGHYLTMGSNYGDLDNDGWDDFYLGTGHPDLRVIIPNRAFHNRGDGTFGDITTSGGFGNLQKGHAVGFGDLDNDGDQDVYEVLGGAYEGDWYPNVLYENPGHGNHWATLRLRGPGANPSAIGARVTLRLATPGGTRTLHRLVGSGGSFGANSLQVEVGLGDATAVEAVSVAWPGGGAAESFDGVKMDGVWRLVAGTGRAEPIAQPAFKLGGGTRDEASGS
ncbi:MAG: CRTAC1 family protein [Ardenticatenales bacterium]